MTMRKLSLCALLAFAAALPSSALAVPAAQLKASFEPDRLGASTTIEMAFKVHVTSGGVPSPLTGVEFRLPAGVVGLSNTLGLATCTPAKLKEGGPAACSGNSRIGQGSAVVAVAIGAGVVYEPVRLSIFTGEPIEGHTAMSFYASGSSPVISQLVFPALLLGDSDPFGARLQAAIPTVTSLPGAPDVALVGMESSIGPKGLVYHKRVHGKVVAFTPEGFAVPSRCPAGGFPFAAVFTFKNGVTESAASRAPCPKRQGANAHR